MRQLTVNVAHDDAAAVWYVQSSDVPGLNAEAASLDELIEVVRDLVPDLLRDNLPDSADGTSDIPLCVQHHVNARRADAA